MNLSTFSDEIIEKKLKQLVRRESLNTVQILKHLAEVERRQLHLRNGYGSLWDYATRGLKYSEPAAQRRITSARALARFSQLEALLIERRISLSTLSLVAKSLSPENFDTVMAEVIDHPKSHVEAFVKSRKPVSHVVEKVTPVTVVPRSLPENRAVIATASPHVSGDSTITAPSRASWAATFPAAVAPQAFKVQCALSDEGYRKLKEVQSLLSHTTNSLGEVVEQLCEFFLDRRSPTREVKRKAAFPREDSRYIPRALEKAVWERDGGCCSYVGPDGTKCGCKHRIQVDHVQPFALGGKTELSNLRLLCAQHNRFAAGEVFGHQTIKEIVGRRREKAAARPESLSRLIHRSTEPSPAGWSSAQGSCG